MRIRGTLRVRNDEMLAARERLKLTQAQVGILSGVGTHLVQELERLNYRYRKTPKVLHDGAEAVAAVLCIAVEAVLPPGAAGERIEHTFVQIAEVDVAKMISCGTERLLLPSPADDERGDREDTIERMRRDVKRLTERQRGVLTHRFGLDGGNPLTLRQIGVLYGVSAGRVQQVEYKAMQTLRRLRQGDDARDEREREEMIAAKQAYSRALTAVVCSRRSAVYHGGDNAHSP